VLALRTDHLVDLFLHQPGENAEPDADREREQPFLRRVGGDLRSPRRRGKFKPCRTSARSLVFTAGACPLNAAGETVAPGDVAAQTEQVMDNLETALRAAGAELRAVAKTTVYVASQRREDLVTAWNVIRARFRDHDAPSTLLGVAVLGYPNQLVEVEAVASLPAP
jgi:enamine deaminase RidA (YjgF/YER057c/UK114 family)